MPMSTWQGRIAPGGKGSFVDVQVQANTHHEAKRLIEAQYGKGTKFAASLRQVRS